MEMAQILIDACMNNGTENHQYSCKYKLFGCSSPANSMPAGRISAMSNQLDKKMSAARRHTNAGLTGLVDTQGSKKTNPVHHALINPIAMLTQAIRISAEVQAQAVSAKLYPCSYYANSLLGQHHPSFLARRRSSDV
jgi:hypothetical protein